MSRHVLDDGKNQAALQLQRQARWAFDLGNFEAALNLYTQAEQLFRESYGSPGDRVFFMQFSALRCLEELIDAGQIDLISERGRRSAAFSEEWTLEVVRSRITPARRGEANAFLAWRRAPINTEPELDRATAAIAARNYAHGREILQELAALAEITDHPERDALLAIIKSKIAMIGKQEEFDKPEHQRDLTKVADAYEKAAEASQLPTASRSAQHARISGFRHWFQSCAYKFKAFVLLNDERAHQDIEKVLERSAAYLRSACVEAETGDDGRP